MSVGIGFGIPVYPRPHYYPYPYRVYVAPAPAVYVRPAPVYVAPEYVQPAPVYVQPAPVYVQPAPVYPQPAATYSPPPPSYSQPAPSYLPPATTYSQPAGDLPAAGFGGGSRRSAAVVGACPGVPAARAVRPARTCDERRCLSILVLRRRGVSVAGEDAACRAGFELGQGKSDELRQTQLPGFR